MKKIVEHNDTSLIYHVYGKGIPVILIHGFAETNSIWNNQSVYLSNYCKLIIPDLPGSGESQLPEMIQKKLSIDDLSESIYSIIKNENLEECIMLGHSMGGYITLAFAEKYPEKLMAFGFVNSSAFADSEEKKQNRARAIEMMQSYGSYAFIKTATPGLFADIFKKQNTDIINELIEAGKNFKKENLQQYYYAMMQRPERTHVVKSNKLPVLFVIGTQDAATPLSDVLKQVHFAEITYIHILENTAHMSMLEVPEKLNRILKNFVNEFE